jgi:hypothetical protein
MNAHTDVKFVKHLASTLLAACSLAAAAAYADPSTVTVAAATPAKTESPQQCAAPSGAAAPSEAAALTKFETGTTFMLTENGLIVLKRPAAKKWYSRDRNPEPEYLNTGG